MLVNVFVVYSSFQPTHCHGIDSHTHTYARRSNRKKIPRWLKRMIIYMTGRKICSAVAICLCWVLLYALHFNWWAWVHWCFISCHRTHSNTYQKHFMSKPITFKTVNLFLFFGSRKSGLVFCFAGQNKPENTWKVL